MTQDGQPQGLPLRIGGPKERGGVPAPVFMGGALRGNNGRGREVRGCLKTGSHKGCPYG